MIDLVTRMGSEVRGVYNSAPPVSGLNCILSWEGGHQKAILTSLQALNVAKSISEPQYMFCWLGLMITLSQLFRSDEMEIWIVLGLGHRLNVWGEQAKLLVQALPGSQCAHRGQCGCAPEG